MTQPSTDNAAPVKDTGDTTPRADAPPRGAGQGVRIQNSSAGTVPAGAESVPAKSQGSIAGANLVEAPAAMPAKSDATAAIESLDAQLAELTAQLLDPKVGPAPVHQEPARAPVAPVVAAASTAAAAPVAGHAAPAAVAAPVPAAIAPVAPPSVPVQAPAAPPVKPVPNRAEAKEPGALLMTLAKMSQPLAGKPALVRAAAGAMAVNSLLLAAGVWAFVVMRPAPSAGVEKEYDFASSSLPMAPVEREPEGKSSGAGSGGGDEVKKSDEKKGAKAPAKGGKKATKQPAKSEEHGHE